MSSTFHCEAGWFLGNVALFLVLAFGLLVASGLALSHGDAIGSTRMDPS
jgi:hypothetical protein